MRWGIKIFALQIEPKVKADALADIYDNVSVIPYASIKQELYKFHTVYVGIYSQTKFFTKNDFIHNPTTKILVDVGLPRTIDSSCETVPHLNVITVDALENVANQTIKNRRSVIPHVESCIRVAISELNDWLSYRDESIDWVDYHRSTSYNIFDNCNRWLSQVTYSIDRFG